MAFQLFTDSDCDMTPETCAEYGYKLISMPYTIEGQLVRPYEDFDKFDAKTFYDTLRSGILPSTSAISEQNYIDYFEPVLKEGKDILYVHFSAAMSNTFDFMNQAIKTLQAKYPERKFYLIDTKGITTISLLIALEVGDMAKAGKTAEEIMEWAETEVDHFAMYFTVDDLKFFHKSGRVSGLSAVMGTLIGIRPIIYMNPEGKMVSCGKEKGRRKAILHLADKVVELGDHVKEHRILISHTDAGDMVDELISAVRERLGEDTKIEVFYCNPTSGAHAGPNGVGIAFHAVRK